MKNKTLLYMGMAFAMAALLLCGCSPQGESVSTPTPTPTAGPTGDPHDKNVPPKPSPTARPTAKPTEGPEIWEGELTIWALPNMSKQVQGKEPTDGSAVIADMSPIIETVVEARCKYETYFFDDLKRYDGTGAYTESNEHLMENQAYVWTVLSEVIGSYGHMHPDAVRGEDGSVTLPESAVRDFIALCFSEYTPEYDLPKAAPKKWAKKQASIGEDAGCAVLSYADGNYICTPASASKRMGGRYIFIGGSMGSMNVYQINWPEARDITTYEVYLEPLEGPNALGFEWGVSIILRVGCTDETQMSQAWQKR